MHDYDGGMRSRGPRRDAHLRAAGDTDGPDEQSDKRTRT